MKPKTLNLTLVYTALALIAFAANSIFARLALGNEIIGASLFTSIRLLSGTLVLLFIYFLKKDQSEISTKGSWFSSFLLFTYAIAFSYAYIYLETGTGALILFGTVQITMILFSIIQGNKLGFKEWLGIILAFTGFLYLILPGVSAPSITGFFLMSLAGIAWGLYTIQGKGCKNPITDTTFNFLKSLLFVLILFLLTFKTENYTLKGVLLAIVSGAITTGLGCAIWYMALKNITTIQAAMVQLLIPVIATIGGLIFLQEKFSYRLSISSLLILGGILLVSKSKKKTNLMK